MSKGVLHNLEPLVFDDLEPAAVISIETSGGQRQAERIFPYLDSAAHEPTGREPYRVRVRLAFLNTWRQNMYPGAWSSWRQRFQDRVSGKLRHPDIGILSAAMVSFSYVLDGRMPHGVIVDVEFVETIEDIDAPAEFEFKAGSSAEIAEEVDNAMAVMGLSYPSGMGSVAGAIARIAKIPAEAIGEVSAQIESTIGQVFQIQQAVEAAVASAATLPDQARDAVQNSVERIALDGLLASLWDSLKSDKAKIEKAAKPTKVHTVEADSTLGNISFKLGADLAGIIQLNPSLLAAPTVPKGTAVKYFA